MELGEDSFHDNDTTSTNLNHHKRHERLFQRWLYVLRFLWLAALVYGEWGSVGSCTWPILVRIL